MGSLGFSSTTLTLSNAVPMIGISDYGSYVSPLSFQLIQANLSHIPSGFTALY